MAQVGAKMRAESERALETYICLVPDSIMQDLKIIGRQIVLPSGRLDILGFTPDGTLWIFELKLDTLDNDALLQVLRYRADIERIGSSILKDVVGHDSASSPAVNCVLVGYDCDEQTKDIAKSLGVLVIYYGCSPNFQYTDPILHARREHQQIGTRSEFDDYRELIKRLTDLPSEEATNNG